MKTFLCIVALEKPIVAVATATSSYTKNSLGISPTV